MVRLASFGRTLLMLRRFALMRVASCGMRVASSDASRIGDDASRIQWMLVILFGKKEK